MKVPGGVGTGVGYFYEPEGRQQYLSLYDEIIRSGPAPQETLDVATSFGSVRVYRHGHVENPPIVLLHGAWGTAASWSSNVVGLAAEHSVYTLDVLGQPGYSVQTSPVRNSADCARWLGDLLAGLDIRGVTLVGASYGAWLAFNQAACAPDRVAGIVLIEPANVLARFSPRFLLGGALMTPGLPGGVTERYLRWMLGDPPCAAMEPILRLVLAGVAEYRMHMTFPHYPSDSILRTVRLPVLTLLGGRSVVHNAAVAAKRARALLSGGQTQLWPFGSHAVFTEFADEVNERILTFAGGLSVG